MFGCNLLFFAAASYPYTEAPAFLLMFLALLVIERSGAAAGAMAGLAFLTRSQNVVFAAALLHRAPLGRDVPRQSLRRPRQARHAVARGKHAFCARRSW